MNRIRVGSFDLYPSERRLLAGDRPVELGARAFDLLLVLAERPGRLVTKATLLERVWPKLVVDENNLPAQVASLRRALGAGAIRTVPGFGYRLELPVSSSQPTEAAAPGSAGHAHEPPRLTIHRRTWPNRLAPLIGRERELGELQQALAERSLVTLVGVAGAGKTRLAEEILTLEADQSGVAVAWVALPPLSDLQHVTAAIALALGLTLAADVDGFTALNQALQDVPVLLILDGAEHLGPVLAAPLASLVRHTRGVRALVTSQTPLGIPGEHVHRLPVLQIPAPCMSVAEASACGAVRFFAQRAAAAERRFELTPANTAQVVEVCRRLDGNPLALELAAARLPALGLAALLERLDDRFRLLKQPGKTDNQRHSTLHAAFDWSYGLLSAAEQRVFDVLGVFAGSFSLEVAARCVADAATDVPEAVDLIARLVDRSLVTAISVEPPRYTLSETARCYALERLTGSQGLETARRRFAQTTLQLLDAAYQEYWAIDEAIWLSRYEPELVNVRASIDWASAHDAELGVGLYGSAWPLFVETDLEAEGRARFEQAVVLLNDALPGARVGRFWEAVASYESNSHCDRARYAAELAAAAHAASGNPRARYYAQLLLALNWRGDQAAARAAYETALALEDPAWPVRLLALGAMTEGALATADGQYALARAAYAQAVRHALAASERQALAATVCIVELDIASGDTAAALQLARPLVLSLRHSGRRETRFELMALTFSALLLAGEVDEARGIGAELLALSQRIDSSKLYGVLDAMAYLACLDDRCDVAARIAVCADQSQAAHGQPGRRPAQRRIRAAVIARLESAVGPLWCDTAAQARLRLDEVSACSLALGLRV
ncbi:MAG TPA: winged helix-turn-helix domain-containing protein [Steroidobacteraceae bacterium]|nr:winged helix-turn-helix domain-containing protein [Steroidobacteraceae bacterium]